MTEKKDNSDIEILSFESIDSDKYDRQKRITGWDQSKVSNATVMVIGVGATGNELVKNLTLTGIGKFIIIDYDIIEKSNLNRCVLFNMKDDIEGKYKVDVVKESATILNPDLEIVVCKNKLNDIDKNLYKQSDVICSCVDNIEARLEANNYAHYYGIPFIDSGIDEYFVALSSLHHFRIARYDLNSCIFCFRSHRSGDFLQVFHRESFLDNKSGRQVNRACASHT